METRDALKPCPFCGCDEISILMLGGSPEYSRVACDSCGASTGRYTKEKAITAWNQRAERTCRNEYEHANSTWWFECSLCGAITSTEWKYIGSDMPKYCPNCGAKVVE